MSKQTRRTFLATVGATGLAGCSAISGDNSTNTPSGTTSQTKTTTTNDGGDGTTNNKTTSSNSNGSQAFADFEDLSRWSALDQMGTLKKSKNAYTGSQAAFVTGGKKTNEGKIEAAAAQFGKNNNLADFSNKSLSLAFKCKSHRYSKISVRLIDIGKRTMEMKRTLVGPKDTWVRVNLGTTGVTNPNNFDLSSIYKIRIIGRPRDQKSSNRIKFLVDDLQTVKQPKKGKVMLTFDDGLSSQYQKAYQLMKKPEYDFPGVAAVITDAIGNGDFMSYEQLHQMSKKNGWDVICHPNAQAKPMPGYSKQKQKQLMQQSKNYLRDAGFDGHKYMAVPKNVVGPTTFKLAQDMFDLTFSWGASPNALPLITKDTLVSRMYAHQKSQTSMRTVKQRIDAAAQYKQLTPLLFHRIGGKNGIPMKDFKTILNYIKKKNVDVVTPSDLDKQGLLQKTPK
ncbi:polysaccharide deacetylase family protein [Halomicrococcus sp. NG-SE-24]|uniref:polysaccharide deacetylase family protein n=1 Tax=Halomicrococcus sp. NG-SE-24 TaxID=3436928 RepID=UPI003D9802D6